MMKIKVIFILSMWNLAFIDIRNERMMYGKININTHFSAFWSTRMNLLFSMLTFLFYRLDITILFSLQFIDWYGLGYVKRERNKRTNKTPHNESTQALCVTKKMFTCWYITLVLVFDLWTNKPILSLIYSLLELHRVFVKFILSRTGRAQCRSVYCVLENSGNSKILLGRFTQSWKHVGSSVCLLFAEKLNALR